MRKTISNSEWEILEKLWDKGDMTIAQLEAAFKDTTGWTRHAIISFLKKMEAKNLVAYEEIGRAKHYRAVPEKDKTVKAESEAFLNRVFDGKIGLMVSSLVDDHLSDEEADELIKLLEKKLSDK